MTNQHESFPDLMHEDSFEVVMRGYSRRQVHDYMNRNRNQIRDLEERLARAIDQSEQSRVELSEARRRLSDSPQDYDELGQRLSQILKLGEEEAASKRSVADIEATKLRDDAAAEAERLVNSARERAEGILNAAQQEAERRVAEATAAAEQTFSQATAASEQMLAQAGGDAEETLNAARTEADETLRSARTEADRMVTSARNEADRMVEGAHAEADATLNSARAEAQSTVASANAEAYSTLTAAQQRATALDETTGRRVSYLTDTHHEVMRRLHEMGAVLGDLIHRENSAGDLLDEASVLPPARVQQVLAVSPSPVAAPETMSDAGPEAMSDAGSEPSSEIVSGIGSEASLDVSPDVEAVRVIVDEEDDRDRYGNGHEERFEGGQHVEVYDDTDTTLVPAVGKKNDREAGEAEEYATPHRK
jgi:cell division septum initiation protein DivIVA